jgi:protein-tyrosine phosphatase
MRLLSPLLTSLVLFPLPLWLRAARAPRRPTRASRGQDSPTEDVARTFDAASDILQRNAELGLTTLVHCSDGRARAAAITLAFLVRKRRATLKQAWALLRRVWTAALPAAVLEQLLAYERSIYGSNSLQLDESAGAAAW